MGAALTGQIEDFKLPGGVAGRRRLAGFLAKAGEEMAQIKGNDLTQQEALAHMMWNLVIVGEIEFPDGRIIMIDEIDQWLAIAKFMYQHLDGPAVTVADARSGNVAVRVVFGNDDPYPEGAPQAG